MLPLLPVRLAISNDCCKGMAHQSPSQPTSTSCSAAVPCSYFCCSYYRAFGDESDANGHGTHVTGTLLGFPYTADSLTSSDTQYIGMAPGARLAFIDLGDGSSDSIYTPADLEGGYFDYTTEKVWRRGALVC